LIPASAHGTNPASAAMANDNYRDQNNIDVEDEKGIAI
jgi:glycine cleavage system protein P-like pyridoxal-binding family